MRRGFQKVPILGLQGGIWAPLEALALSPAQDSEKALISNGNLIIHRSRGLSNVSPVQGSNR